MEAKYLKINPADNVAVAITALPAGEKLTVDGKGITLNEDVPAGPKFALKDFAEGENVIKYGYPIGHARKAQKQGDWMNENNIKTNLSGLLEYTYNPVNVDLNTTTLNLNTGAPNLTFRGYKRKNGDVGVRNEIWIIPTIGSCVSSKTTQSSLSALFIFFIYHQTVSGSSSAKIAMNGHRDFFVNKCLSIIL